MVAALSFWSHFEADFFQQLEAAFCAYLEVDIVHLSEADFCADLEAALHQAEHLEADFDEQQLETGLAFLKFLD